MTDAKRPLKVFLCHASADKPAVRALYTRLTKDGVDAWLDKEKLLPGQDWELEIRKAVRESDVVVVCLSKQFNQAGFRQKEVRLALDTAMEQPEGEIFIIPARLEECDTLESLRRWHWVDLFEDGGYNKLKQTLGLRANRVDALFKLESEAALGSTTLESYPLSGQIGILNTKATNIFYSGATDEGIKLYLQAIRLSDEIGDFRAQAILLTNLGYAYWMTKNFFKAKESFEQSLLLSRKIGDKKSEAAVLTILARAYESEGDLVRAFELYEHALMINSEIGI